MNTAKRAVAQLLLMFPAVFFMGALALRKLQPLQNEPAQTAQRIVMWYAARHWTLLVLLIALPFAVLVIGFITLARNWRDDMELPQAALQTFAAIPHGPDDASRRCDDLDGRSRPRDCHHAYARELTPTALPVYSA